MKKVMVLLMVGLMAMSTGCAAKNTVQPVTEVKENVVEVKETDSEEIKETVEVVEETEAETEESNEIVIKVTEQPKLIVSEEPNMGEGIYEKGDYDDKKVSYYRTFSEDGIVVIFIFEDTNLEKVIANREDIEILDYTISDTAEPKINLKIDGKEYLADINADISNFLDENGNMYRNYNLMEKVG